jgi:hypothetical protein
MQAGIRRRPKRCWGIASSAIKTKSSGFAILLMQQKIP